VGSKGCGLWGGAHTGPPLPVQSPATPQLLQLALVPVPRATRDTCVFWGRTENQAGEGREELDWWELLTSWLGRDEDSPVPSCLEPQR
jgi:hypothetical protein